MNNLSIRAAQARQRFESVKRKGLKATVAETGAIDLASIMVGVLVIGIVGGVIAATVFAVIPWSQDQAAGQALQAVSTAESVAFAQSSGAGTGVYLDEVQLAATDGLGGTEGLVQASPKIQIVVGSSPATFTSYSASATGKVFTSNSASPSTVTEVTVAELTAAGFEIDADGKLVDIV